VQSSRDVARAVVRVRASARSTHKVECVPRSAGRGPAVNPFVAGVYIDVSPNTLAVWRSCPPTDIPPLPWVRAGAEIRYFLRDLDDWLEQCARAWKPRTGAGRPRRGKARAKVGV
jgi:hypothetical protein